MRENKIMKELFFDTETTGLNPKTNSIIQLAGYIKIDKEIKEEFDFRIKPYEDNNIQIQESIKIHKIPVEEMFSYPDSRDVFPKVIDLFDKYINKYDKEDKFIPAGQNVSFDIEMLYVFFLRNNNKFLGSYINFSERKDLLPLIQTLRAMGKIDIPNSKLETVCNYFGIEIESHNALSDIIATGKVFDILDEKLILNL